MYEFFKQSFTIGIARLEEEEVCLESCGEEQAIEVSRLTQGISSGQCGGREHSRIIIAVVPLQPVQRLGVSIHSVNVTEAGDGTDELEGCSPTITWIESYYFLKHLPEAPYKGQNL